MKSGNYDDRDYEYGEDMMSVYTDCRHFSGRRDVNSFNMTNYRSCENCRHMGSDYHCSFDGSTRHQNP